MPNVTEPASGRREQRRRRHQLLSREQLLDAAEEIFGRKGYHDTTLKEVAELAEFSVGSVYSFFDNKDDLFRQIFLRRGEEFMPELRAVLADEHGTPLERLHRLVDFQVRWFREHPHFGRLYLRHPDRDMDAVIEANYQEAMHLEAELIRSGQRAGTFRAGDPEALARLFSGLMGAFQALDPAVVSDDPDADERFSVDELHDLVEATFTAGRAVGDAPRPPEGDWLGTPFLRFERHGVLAHVIVDRPEARNALTPAMYFGIRYAIDHVNRDADLAGLLITGTRRRVHPRRRARRPHARRLGHAAPARHGRRAVRRGAPVAEADRVRGQRHLPGRRDDDRDAQRRGRGVRARHVPRARAVPRHRRHPLRPHPPAPDRARPAPATCC